MKNRKQSKTSISKKLTICKATKAVAAEKMQKNFYRKKSKQPLPLSSSKKKNKETKKTPKELLIEEFQRKFGKREAKKIEIIIQASKEAAVENLNKISKIVENNVDKLKLEESDRLGITLSVYAENLIPILASLPETIRTNLILQILTLVDNPQVNINNKIDLEIAGKDAPNYMG